MAVLRSIQKDNINVIIRETIKILKNGGIILYPTETLYGIGCDANNEKAIEKIARFKQRNRSTPKFSIGIGNKKQITEIAIVQPKYQQLIKQSLPGPYTYILQSKKIVLPGLSSIGVRVPEDSFFSKLLNKSNMKLITTSANKKGEEAPKCYAEVTKEVINFVDMAINGKCTKYGNGSSIIDLQGNSPIIRRKGVGKLEILKDYF